MKNKIFSDSLAIVSLITAGLVMTTNAKPQAHGHHHGHASGGIVHKQIASSGSSLNITTLGAADSNIPYSARFGGYHTNLPSRLRCCSYGYWHCSWA